MERGTGKGSVGQVDCTGVKESVRNGRGHGAGCIGPIWQPKGSHRSPYKFAPQKIQA